MPGTTKTIVAEVIAVIPEYHQTITVCGGYQYAITLRTPGPAWHTMVEGDMVTMEVFTASPIVKEVINVNP